MYAWVMGNGPADATKLMTSIPSISPVGSVGSGDTVYESPISFL